MSRSQFGLESFLDFKLSPFFPLVTDSSAMSVDQGDPTCCGMTDPMHRSDLGSSALESRDQPFGIKKPKIVRTEFIFRSIGLTQS